MALLEQGDLDGAVATFKKALRLTPAQPSVQRLLPVAERLLGVLAGDDRPTSVAESCALAALCVVPRRGRYAAAVRLYEQPLAAPHAADRLPRLARYDAARYAARAARGDGADAPPGEGQPAFRAKALTWLRAELAGWRERAGSPYYTERVYAAEQLARWMRDPDLSGVRPGAALPEAERAAWEALWADVLTACALARTPP
jgi:tetratricopeptide (TPR) repeat protein